MSQGLLDTSVVISIAAGESVRLPDESAISAITLCELHHGVLSADNARRAARLATLVMAERTFQALPVDERVAPPYGRIVAASRASGLRRPRAADALIAATAAAHRLTLYTRDTGFESLEGVEVVLT